MESFEQWWSRVGFGLFPNAGDEIYLGDKKGIAEAAWTAAVGQSRNYTADEEVMPEKITFGNGRVVYIADIPNPGVHNGVFLEVGQLPD